MEELEEEICLHVKNAHGRKLRMTAYKKVDSFIDTYISVYIRLYKYMYICIVVSVLYQYDQQKTFEWFFST